MALKITPGPLPPDGTRIKVSEVIQKFVSNTSITQFGADDIGGGEATFLISATDPPATDSRARNTLWFQRGAGALWKWQPVPVATTVTSAFVGVTDFRWVQLGGTKRSNIVHVRKLVEAGEVCQIMMEICGGVNSTPAGTATDGLFKFIRSTNNDFTMEVAATSPHSGHLGRQYIVDPVLVCETQITAGSEYHVFADWGFVDAQCYGSGKYGALYGYQGSGASEGSAHIYFQATGHSAAGVNGCIAALISGSNATDGLATRQVFLRPSITNIVHGEN